MNRKITVAVSFAALAVLGACGRGDRAAYDTAVGATSGAMATPPVYPGAGAGMGTTTGATTGMTTGVMDTTKTHDTSKTGAKRP